jgi:excisionase family DNA binding protein
MDVQSAAKLAGRTPETIRRWVWSGRLNAHKRGNKLVVRRSDVQRLAGPAQQRQLSLREWAALARTALMTSRGPYSSAADLVLGERAARLGETGGDARR